MDDKPSSVAVDVVRSLAWGVEHLGEDTVFQASKHLRMFIAEDGRMPMFLNELAAYIESAEKKARKDTL